MSVDVMETGDLGPFLSSLPPYPSWMDVPVENGDCFVSPLDGERALSHSLLRRFVNEFPLDLFEKGENQKDNDNPLVVCSVVGGGTAAAVMFLAGIHHFQYAPISPSLPLEKLRWEIGDAKGSCLVIHAPPLSRSSSTPSSPSSYGGVKDQEIANAIIAGVELGLSILIMQPLPSSLSSPFVCPESLSVPVGLFNLLPLSSFQGNQDFQKRMCTAAPSHASLFHSLFTTPSPSSPSSPPSPLSPPSSSSQRGILLHTSGTTSTPKSLLQSTPSLTSGALAIQHTLSLSSSDRGANCLSLTHLHGLAVNVLVPVVSGGSVVCLSQTFSAGGLLECVRKREVTWYSAVPTVHRMVVGVLEEWLEMGGEKEGEPEELASSFPLITECPCTSSWDRLVTPSPPRCCCPRRSFPSLRFIRNCSAPLPLSIAERLERLLHCVVVPTYAMSEAVPICSNPVGRDREPPKISSSSLVPLSCLCPGKEGELEERKKGGRQKKRKRDLGTVGFVGGPFVRVKKRGGVELTHLGEEEEKEEKEGKEGERIVGEVEVRGRCVITQYLCQTTTPCFTDDGYLKTGDIGYLDPNGRLVLCGRSKEIINRGGEKESVVYIESVAGGCLPNKEIIAFPVKHALLGQVVGVGVVAKELAGRKGREEVGGGKVGAVGGGELRMTLAQVQSLMRWTGQLEEKWLPTVVVYLPSLPLTPSGKKKRINFADELGLPIFGEWMEEGEGKKGLGKSGGNVSVWEAERGEGGEGWALSPYPKAGWGDGEEKKDEKEEGEEGEEDQEEDQEGKEEQFPTLTCSSTSPSSSSSSSSLSLATLTNTLADHIYTVLPPHIAQTLPREDLVSPSSPISQNKLIDLGVDSMGMVVLSQRLSDALKMRVKPSLFDRYGTIHNVAEHLLNRLEMVKKKELRKEIAKEKGKGEKKGKKKKEGGEGELGGFRSEEVIGWARDGENEKVKEVISSLSSPELFGKFLDRFGNNALHWAAGEGHAKVVREIIEKKAIGVDDVGGKETGGGGGRTALMWACRNGQLEVGKVLVELGADLRATTKKGVAPIHWAVWGGSIQIVNWLHKGHNISLETLSDAGCNCAVWAAAAGDIDMCKYLEEEGADFNLLNHWGHGVVVKAVWKGHLKVLEYLLSLEGVGQQVFLVNPAGECPKQLAELGGHKEVVEFLENYMNRVGGLFRPAPVSLMRVHQHKLEEIEGRLSDRIQQGLVAL